MQVEEAPRRQQLNHMQRLAGQLQAGAGGNGREGRVNSDVGGIQSSPASTVQKWHIPEWRNIRWSARQPGGLRRPAFSSRQQPARAAAAHPQHQQQVPPQVRPLVPCKLHVIPLNGVAVQQVPTLKINLLGRGWESNASKSQGQARAGKGAN